MTKKMKEKTLSKTKKKQVTILDTVPHGKYSSTPTRLRKIGGVGNDYNRPSTPIRGRGYRRMKLLHLIDPRYQLPCRKTVTQMLPDITCCPYK